MCLRTEEPPNTTQKQQNSARVSVLYVAPRTLYLGRRRHKQYIAAIGEYIVGRLYFNLCEFQYVSMINTLKSWFIDDQFRYVYFQHNHVWNFWKNLLQKFVYLKNTLLEELEQFLEELWPIQDNTVSSTTDDWLNIFPAKPKRNLCTAILWWFHTLVCIKKPANR